MTASTTRILATFALIGTLGLAACDGEDSRPLNYKPGVYLGKPDTPLTDETLETLRQRANYQRDRSGLVGPSASIGGTTRGASVRPPEPKDNASAQRPISE